MARKTAYANGKHDLRRGIDFIGVSCAFVCHDGKGKVLLHKRSQNCRDEQGRWDNGGGAHEFGSTLEETARREIAEEYGTEALHIQYIATYDAHRQLQDGTPTHWIGVLYAAELDPRQAQNHEPYKIDEIGWFTLDNLPQPLHSLTPRALAAVHNAGII